MLLPLAVCLPFQEHTDTAATYSLPYLTLLLITGLEIADTWRRISIYVVIPALCIASVNAWRLWSEHWEHKAHEPPIEEQPEYPYQNIRTKNYFWGDGDKVSLNSCLSMKSEMD